MCEAPKEGEACTLWDPAIGMCQFDKNFCDWDGANPGTCKACPTDLSECYREGFTTHENGKNECRGCYPRCFFVDSSELSVGGKMMASQTFQEAIQSSESEATGALHNCTVLALDPKSTCDGAEGKICVVKFGDENTNPWIAQVTNQAERSGCVGVIAFVTFDVEFFPSHWNAELLIPSVWVSQEDGAMLLNEKMGEIANVKVDVYGAGCFSHWGWSEGARLCNDEAPCNSENFCNSAAYDRGEEQFGSDGYCFPCPRDASGAIHPMSCYFENFYDDNADTVANVESCVSSCTAEAQLISENCKFCTSQLTEFKFGIENEEERCLLCPQDDVQYPNRVVQLLDDNVTCSKLDSFFQRLPVSKDSSNCELIQSMNYICGCEGAGYAGANTTAKQNALVWMPRVSAILSILRLYPLNTTIKARLEMMPPVRLKVSSYKWAPNNTASYWPDIPIAVAILNATIVMGIVCFDVHKKVQAFKREQERGEETGSLSTK
eukprot:scaffold116398_cov30-Cyclotella_meneghiniana.AAC.1